MKVYHYARTEDWNRIKNGSYKSDNLPGLGASKSVGKHDDEAFDTRAVFALLEPLPREWVSNEHFKLTWESLKSDLSGRVLLEIEVDDRMPAFVIDCGMREGVLYEDKTGIPGEYLFENRKAAERAYIGNKVPLQEYVKNPEKYKFSLPEVIITAHVPFENIRISEQQPLLEEYLPYYKKAPIVLEEILLNINYMPELKAWYEKRIGKIPPPKEQEYMKFR
jgi:hypothetical protein